DGVQLALLEERQAIALGVRWLAPTVDEGDLGLRIDAEMAQGDPGVHVRAALAVATQALAAQLPRVLDPRLRHKHVRRVVGDRDDVDLLVLGLTLLAHGAERRRAARRLEDDHAFAPPLVARV